MTDLPQFKALEADLDQIAVLPGYIVVFVPDTGKLDQMALRLNSLMLGALERFVESSEFTHLSDGDARSLAFPVGVEAKSVIVARLSKRTRTQLARGAGASVAKIAVDGPVTLLAGARRDIGEIAIGYCLRTYAFKDHLSEVSEGDNRKVGPFAVSVMTSDSRDAEDQLSAIIPLVEGVFFTRDLVNEPANILTTTEFADRLEGLAKLGVKIEVLDERALKKIGMRTLLAVGEGSESPSKVVVMNWCGGGKETPLALVGKGVVFDTGGISLKPPGGMEEMTMDMGGAGTVAGVMKTLALRKAKANVVGLVGLVENMPDGRAQRPGDVVRSMKGDTVEVINTDAEGRLVLCDLMWYAQDRFSPSAMIDLATLTGAIVIALGHENAGVFSNNEEISKWLLASASTEGEGAWRMPLGVEYDKKLKSRIADMKNVGGRPAGAVTAAQFLQRFVKDETPWVHLDIAGVASRSSESKFAPKGATGWGVLSLNRLVADRFEK
ncbi:MAG: leucyl aminopeptidase [Boseongicola sp.]